jgi:hypothetical protein
MLLFYVLSVIIFFIHFMANQALSIVYQAKGKMGFKVRGIYGFFAVRADLCLLLHLKVFFFIINLNFFML